MADVGLSTTIIKSWLKVVAIVLGPSMAVDESQIEAVATSSKTKHDHL